MFLDHTQRRTTSVGLLWTSDQLVAETSTWQHTTQTTDKYPCHRWDSNPQSLQASGHSAPHANGSTRSCFAKSSCISAGPCTIQFFFIFLIISKYPKSLFIWCFMTNILQAFLMSSLTLILLTWRIWWAPNNASRWQTGFNSAFNPLNPELNPICYLLALLGAHHFLHVSRIRVKSLTLRRLMSYIYIWSTHSWCF